MRIPINLASQPFRRDRAMVAASIAVSLALVATLGALIWLALADRTQLAGVRGEVNQLNQQVRKLAADQGQIDAVLRKPQNAEVLERSVFINTLLLRKGISWTQIFADLEKTLPYNVRIQQIHPSVTADNAVMLDMTVASESPLPVIELLTAFVRSPLFRRVELHSELPPTQSEPLYRCRVSVNYAQKL
jgi:type IV pilus assembly protein PilN